MHTVCAAGDLCEWPRSVLLGRAASRPAVPSLTSLDVRHNMLGANAFAFLRDAARERGPDFELLFEGSQ